jgi:signal peptidase I
MEPSKQPPLYDPASTPIYPGQKQSVSNSDGGGWKSIGSTLLLLLIAPVIAFAIAAFVIQSYQVDGESMQNTLQNNDRLIVNKLPRTLSRVTHKAYVPKRGDIIVFNQTLIQDIGVSGDKQLIKRVIALPGEQISIQDGVVIVYNKDHPQGFNPDKTTGYKLSAVNTSGFVNKQTVPKGNIFVLGDNRPNSEDSRYFGPINTNKIVGRLILRIVPLNKIDSF